MFGLFKRKNSADKNEALIDWSFLQTDMHSHLIPGIDDGAETMEESLKLLKDLERIGFSKIITTPHISFDYYPNEESKILDGLEALKIAAAANNIHIKLHAAAEYMLDESFMQKLEENVPLLTLDGKHLLFEMGFVQEHPQLLEAIFQMQARGYIPVLAHPERYNYYIDQPLSRLQALKDVGCLLQLNVTALTGYYGKHIKMFAESILNAEMYDFAGSDLHHSRHFQALSYVLKSSNKDRVVNYLFKNSHL